ncbi:hypothetical protein C6N75_11225 [Streptomyces solincola]|uniref:DUF1963 domain-containing protein n=1 Tax=Streptomyces solincola TaxID=2100817 RepID=A0A2S9PXI1_9ACTN|nr:hypothetical protein [Streptomyces solincola]PRH79134.1 hypothetical protein C6N75_11225 [Streptomyces solincola]
MSRTTPPRPFDVAAAFPRLVPLARTATRLHPRPGSPTPYESSVGGPLLWPAGEPWPYCQEEHEWHDGRVDDWLAGFQQGPNAMLPVVQLYVRDAPQLRPPAGADLLQVLWCPCEHPPEYKPPTALVWRSSTEVADVLTAPPKTQEVEYEEYVPVPCVLAPEQITEYPGLLALDKDFQGRLADRGEWLASGSDVDAAYAAYPDSFYSDELSLAPGWKVGGWPPWGLTDPVVRHCAACGTGMDPLLTVPSGEWDSSTRGWIPYEDRADAAPGTENPPGVVISRGNHLQLYVCPASPDHPHATLIQ